MQIENAEYPCSKITKNFTTAAGAVKPFMGPSEFRAWVTAEVACS
jgi:hypothetical protein